MAGADDVARAGACRRSLDPRLLAQVLEPQLLRLGQRMSLAQRQVHRVLEQVEAAQAGSELLAHALELEQQHEVELAAVKARNDRLGLALGEAHVNGRV